MTELELISNEVSLLRSCLNYRVLQLEDGRKKVYERLIQGLYGVGLFRFTSFEIACLVLSLMDFADQATAIGHDHLHDQCRDLADRLHNIAFGRPIEIVPEDINFVSTEMAVLGFVS
jgi:hypothetical protein